MGEYEELNDLVRDGSKKLRDSKSLSDETVFMYCRPRQFPPGMHPSQQQPQPMAISPPSGSVSVATNPYHSPASSPAPQYASTAQDHHGNVSPTGVASNVSSPSNLRKRVFSADKSRGSRYKSQSQRSAAPKLKAHPRDGSGRSSSRTRSGVSGHSQNAPAQSSGAPSPAHGYHRGNSVASHHTAQAQQGVHGMLNCNPAGSPAPADSGTHHRNYFQQQCNFFPGNSDWTEALGFSVNSLWNCGANGGHLSPTVSPHSASPRSSHGGGGSVHAPTTGGGVYHGSGAAAPYSHHATGGYGHPPAGSAGYGAGGGGYGNYSTGGGGGYRGVDEGRNPSSGGYGGYGSGRTGTGVRDTVVM